MNMNHRVNLGAKVFTTGQIAKVCMVATRTVTKWVDSGKLHAYRIPGSQDRRIPRESLIRFLREHGMYDAVVRMNSLSLCLLCGLPLPLEQRLREMLPDIPLRVARDLFSVGLALQENPGMAVLDLSIGPRDETRRAVERLVEDCRRVIVLLPEDAPSVLGLAFDGAKLLINPVSAEKVAELLREDL